MTSKPGRPQMLPVATAVVAMVLGIVLLAPVSRGSADETGAATRTLISGGGGFKELFDDGFVGVSDATLSFGDGETLVEVAPGSTGRIEIKPRDGYFNAEDFTRLVFELGNRGESEVKYELRLENDRPTETARSAAFTGWISPGQNKPANVYFFRDKSVRDKFPELKVFEGMRSLPGGLMFDGRSIDPGKIKRISISIFPSGRETRLSLGSVYASHPPVPALLKHDPERFFPFIDRYGQFIHGTWPGKVGSDEDLRQASREEEQDLDKHPGPENRSLYGGWTAGPRLEATGFFRVEKHDGKWWLVDPEGYLFWSHGVTCCGFGGADTAIAGRERYFSGLPEAGSPLAQFYTKGGAVFMFTQANLHRKYGSDWAQKIKDITHRRLKSWGMNTLGNWSNPAVMYLRKTPYTVAVEYKSDTVTSRGFPDVFSPSFRENLRQALEEKKESFDDPWCIGYFIDNELKFGSPMSFMEDVTKDPPQTPMKREWVKELESRHKTIEEFNRLAGTDFAGWDALLANRTSVKLAKLADTVNEFYKRMCETYFKTCREEQKRVAPRQLYLGCRFLQVVGPELVAVAADFCDVISFNIYEFGVASRRIEGADKPFIVGEFHFGALDRGMFGTGFRWAGDQQDRAGLYEDYVRGAVENPYCVGTHWFQYHSQAFTGRNPDGENFQIGLLDITGNPYPELRSAIRKIGESIYDLRQSSRKKTDTDRPE